MRKTDILLAITKLNMTLQSQIEKELQHDDMTLTSFRVLMYLYRKGKSKTQTIGKVASISSGAITYVTTQLSEKNYVSKTKDPLDKRITWVQLTPEGQMFFKNIYQKHLKHLNQMFSSFTEEELKTLFDVIRQTEKKLGDNNNEA